VTDASLPRFVIRPASVADLPAAAAIYIENDHAADRRRHPLTGLAEADQAARTTLAIEDLHFLTAENSRQVWVAEEDGEIVGVAAAALRGKHWHLTYLFVRLERQVRGIGGALLRQIHQVGRDAGCTVFTLHASDDPRALTRYYRLGLAPRPPHVIWISSEPVFPTLDRASPFEAIPIRLGDDAVLNTADDIDKAVRGVSRPRDIQSWLESGATGAILIDRRTATPAGYFLIAAEPESGRIGPVAAMDEDRFIEVLSNALTAAAPLHRSGATWILIVPGENQAAVAPLLTAGFRPSYGETFFATGPIGRFDRYIPHDLDLL
jgi:GNAT superfamily N-acetyltransferase